MAPERVLQLVGHRTAQLPLKSLLDARLMTSVEPRGGLWDSYPGHATSSFTLQRMLEVWPSRIHFVGFNREPLGVRCGEAFQNESGFCILVVNPDGPGGAGGGARGKDDPGLDECQRMKGAIVR